MDIQTELARAVEELLGRASGPFHFRLVLQPLMATIFAVRAGFADAKAGRPPFLHTFLNDPSARRGLFRSMVKDVGKVFLLAIVLDVVYQVVALKTVHPLQVLLVAVVLAIVPYVILRGPVDRLVRAFRKRDAV